MWQKKIMGGRKLSSENLLEVKHLNKKFQDSEPLKDINCVINSGEVISIIGPSGTGKSTFLRCINRLEKPTGGKIFFHGEEITDDPATLQNVRQKIGMVFQSFNLFSNMNVLENIITAPMTLKKNDRETATKKALELLERVGLAQKILSYPDELSGGQQQRIAIVRTLAMEPEIILFDEPTSALDPRMVDDVLYVMRSLATKNYTMLIVTHEMRFAENVSNRIFFMNDGLIYEEGTPKEIFHSPQKDATKIFIQRLKTYETILTDSRFDFISVQTGIENFARRQFMSNRRRNMLQLIFEELVFELLVKRRGNIFPVDLNIWYDETDDNCIIKVTYCGEKYNPLDDDEEDISVKIVSGVIKKSDYKFEDKNILELQCQ